MFFLFKTYFSFILNTKIYFTIILSNHIYFLIPTKNVILKPIFLKNNNYKSNTCIYLHSRKKNLKAKHTLNLADKKTTTWCAIADTRMPRVLKGGKC